MILTGLVSVTFRKLSAEQIIMLVRDSGLDGIEWGGDIHVPSGNFERASEVGRLTKQAGLHIAAYGSYYRVGCENSGNSSFEQVLETALHLGAPTIRVWAGNKGTYDASSAWWDQVVEDSRRIASLAKNKGITISFEYHGNTLSDSLESTLKLIQLCDHDNINTLWQPSVNINHTERLESLNKVSPWLSNVHVFHWIKSDKVPLSDGESDWLKYLQAVSEIPGDRYALMEFVRDESQEQFKQDAATLRDLVNRVNNL